jgi:hypothetical protein
VKSNGVYEFGWKLVIDIDSHFHPFKAASMADRILIDRVRTEA